jgi:hypothetical protein
LPPQGENVFLPTKTLPENTSAGFGFAVKQDGNSNPQRLTDKNFKVIITENSVWKICGPQVKNLSELLST